VRFERRHLLAQARDLDLGDGRLRWSSSTRDWSAAKSALASLAETPLVAQPPTNSAIVAHSARRPASGLLMPSSPWR
jgi:hypothetical protein